MVIIILLAAKNAISLAKLALLLIIVQHVLLIILRMIQVDYVKIQP